MRLFVLRALFAFLESPLAVGLLLLLIVALALQGCATVFDSEAAAVRELEQHAYKHRQFDRDVQIKHVFTDNPHSECQKRGTLLGKYIPSGKLESDGYRIRACAVMSTPCVVVLPYNPTKLIVREEELHCRYGDFHGGEL